jgi:hypothetical protein
MAAKSPTESVEGAAFEGTSRFILYALAGPWNLENFRTDPTGGEWQTQRVLKTR